MEDFKEQKQEKNVNNPEQLQQEVENELELLRGFLDENFPDFTLIMNKSFEIGERFLELEKDDENGELAEWIASHQQERDRLRTEFVLKYALAMRVSRTKLLDLAKQKGTVNF